MASSVKFLSWLLHLGVLACWSCENNADADADCADGSKGCACYGNETCDDGLRCSSKLTCIAVTKSSNSDASTPRSDDSSTEVDASAAEPMPEESCEPFPVNFDQDTTIAEGCYNVKAVPSFSEGTTLTLTAGVQLYFSAGVWLEIPDLGGLRSLGTEAAPVLLTSRSKEPGAWGGVMSIHADMMLQHTVIEYAGSPIPRDPMWYCVAEVDAGFLGGQGSMRVTDSVFRNNRGFGAAVFRNDCNDIQEFERNTFTDNDWPLATSPSGAGLASESNRFTGNRVDRIELTEEYPNRSLVTWPNLGVPIFAPNGLFARKTNSIVISPGVHILMGEDTQIQVIENGLIRGEGTDAEPIVFEPATPGESWGGAVCEDDGVVDFSGIEVRGAVLDNCP